MGDLKIFFLVMMAKFRWGSKLDWLLEAQNWFYSFKKCTKNFVKECVIVRRSKIVANFLKQIIFILFFFHKYGDLDFSESRLSRDRLKISVLILSEFGQINQLQFLNLTYSFLMISGGMEVN